MPTFDGWWFYNIHGTISIQARLGRTDRFTIGFLFAAFTPLPIYTL
jgi:hypothetical protein